ncbi:LemA family protein [uncultured Cytophaga sp.]|uniref:LemA family protein n=1 Tax=uncultured Cytophaga sp. TaxID=160238 RepID=UPI002610ED08|nr:LemA family protein [uncultured Cytophaga sp.]
MAILVILIPIVLIIFWLVSIYNSLVGLRNRREQAFSDIDVQLKQRSDLVPQLVETVKGYAGHESKTLTDVIAARNSVLSASSIDDKIKSDNQLTSALQGLRITVEAYPDLKANQNFLQLQQEISDIENKLAAARRFFNAATKEYNTSVESFPNNMIAKRYNFQRETMYDVGAEKRQMMEEPPVIKF